jgi:superfamily II DNA/RNA helicase
MTEEGAGARTSFQALGLSPETIETLARRAVTEPFQIQAMVIPDALEGRDVLAKSRTGSGKTLAFAAPIVERLTAGDPKPSALILVPTRELAVQVTGEFKDLATSRGLRVAEVYGGTSIKDQSQRAAKAHIIVATPGRLLDLVRRRAFSLDKLAILVLDEADRMLDMGFQPQVDEIVDLLPVDRQTMFFSATLDGQVGFLAGHYTRAPKLHEVHSKLQTVDEVAHRFVKVDTKNKVDRAIEQIGEADGLTLVFVRTKRGADRLGYRMRNKGVDAVVMHGDLTQVQREKALKRFDEGKVRVLIATDVAARGLDLDDISHVMNYDPPDDDKNYVHRVGRTARAGRSGVGVTLVMPDEEIDVGRMADRLGLRKEYEAGDLIVAPPRVVFSSHGRRSSLRPPRSRRL